MTEKQNRTRLYRIGDYARFMGVSTDLLKHYEKCGLLKSVVADNGYRYYPFQASVSLLECMRLQSYGLSLREVHELLHNATFDTVQRTLDQRTAEIEKQLRFQQLLIDEHRQISSWMSMMQDCCLRVAVKEVEPVLFLPQSQLRDFITDKRISELLPTWIDAMPLVKSCCFSSNGPDSPQRSWGLAIRESAAKALQLPVNDVVKHIAGGRYIHVHFRHTQTPQEPLPLDAVRQAFAAHGVPPESPVLHFALMSLCPDDQRSTCGWFCAPLNSASGTA